MAGKNRYTLDLTDGSKLVFDVRPGASMREIKTEADKALDKKNAEDERAFYKKSGDKWASGVSGAVAGESRKAKAPVEVPKFKPAKSVLSFARPTLEDRFPTKQWKPNLDDTRTELLPKPVLEQTPGERLMHRQDEAGVYDQPGAGSRILQHYLGWQMGDEAAGLGSGLAAALTLQDPIAAYQAGNQAEDIRLDRAWDEAGPSGIYPAIAGSFLSGGRALPNVLRNATRFSGLAPDMIEGAARTTAIPRATPTSIKPLLESASKLGGTTGVLHGWGSGEGLQDSLYEAAGQGLTGAVAAPLVAGAVHGVANAPIVRAIAADKRGSVVMPWHATPDELGRLNNIALKMHQQKASPAEISIASGGWHFDPFSKQWLLELPDTGSAIDYGTLLKMEPGKARDWRDVIDFPALRERVDAFAMPGTTQPLQVGPMFDPDDPAGRYFRGQHSAQINVNTENPLGWGMHEIGGHAYANATGMLGGSNTRTAPQVYRGRYIDPFMAELQPQYDLLQDKGYDIYGSGIGNPPDVNEWITGADKSIEEMTRFEGYARDPGENMAEALRLRMNMPADTRLVTPLQNSMPYPFSQQLNPAGGFGLTGSDDPMQPGEYNKPLAAYTQPLIKNIGLTPMATKSGPLTPDQAAAPPEPFEPYRDESGKPMTVYHGTKGDFDVFDPARQGQSDFGASGRGFYFSQDQGTANLYAQLTKGEGDPKVKEALLHIKNPYFAEIVMMPRNAEESALFTEKVKALGHDAIIVRGKDGTLDELVVFQPEQVQWTGPSSLTPEQTMIDPTEEADQAIRAYHATRQDFDQYDPALAGNANTVGGGEPASFFTDDLDTAHSYLGGQFVKQYNPGWDAAREKAEIARWHELLKASEKIPPFPIEWRSRPDIPPNIVKAFDDWDAARSSAKAEAAQVEAALSERYTPTMQYPSGSNIRPVDIDDSNLLSIDAGGAQYSPEMLEDALEQARSQKKDGVALTNFYDWGGAPGTRSKPQSTIAMLNPDAVRSGFSGPLTPEQTMIDPTEEADQAIRTWHGGPYGFDRFDNARIGTGEGHQSYGYGHYLAEKPEVAMDYRYRLSRNKNPDDEAFLEVFNRYAQDGKIALPDGGMATPGGLLQAVQRGFFPLDKMNDDLRQVVEPLVNKGYLYETDINAEQEDFLDRDKTLADQSPKVKAAISAIPENVWDWMADEMENYGMNPIEPDDTAYKGHHLIRALERYASEGGIDDSIELDDPRQHVSEFFRRQGLPGFTYFDQGSREGGKGTRNYVVFDDSLIDIVNRSDMAEKPPKPPALPSELTAEDTTSNFDKWFDGSKIVDDQGQPLTVYHHGSFDERGDIPTGPMHYGTKTAAEMRAVGKRGDDTAMAVETYQDDDGAWHWDDDGWTSEEAGLPGWSDQIAALEDGRAAALIRVENVDMDDDGIITAAHLNLRNPKRVLDVGGAEGEWDAVIAQAKAEGHDGIVYRNKFEDKGKDSYIAFEPTQIKSVNNRGTFDPNDPDITHAAAPPKPPKPLTAEDTTSNFDKWFGDSKAVDEQGKPLTMYHGTGRDIQQFEGMPWTSSTPALADEYAFSRGLMGQGDPNVMPLFTKAERPFDADSLPKTVTRGSFFNEALEQANAAGRDIDIPKARALLDRVHAGAQAEESGPNYSRHDFWNNADDLFGQDGAAAIRELFQVLGFDSVKMTEGGDVTYGTFDPTQVKSTFNRGTFDPNDPRIDYAEKPPEPPKSVLSGFDKPN